MDLQKFLKNNNIKISNNGNICVNDIIDYLILPINIYNVSKKVSNNDEIEYYLSPKYCYNMFKNNNKLKKLNMFLNLLSSDLNIKLKNFSIYVISTHYKANINEFKVGKFSGSMKKLISRYNTTLITPIIFYYREVNNYTLIEKQILSDLDEFRIINANGNKTEWIRLDKDTIINIINKNINEFDEIHEIEIFNNKTFTTFKNSFMSLEKNILEYNKKEIIIIIDDDGNSWFSGKSVASILGYVNESKAIRDHVKKKNKTTLDKLAKYLIKIPLNAQLHSIYINEPGLFSLIFSSKTNEGEKFKDWILEEVLPSIRKYDKYIMNEKYKIKLNKLNNKIKELKEENGILERVALSNTFHNNI